MVSGPAGGRRPSEYQHLAAPLAEYARLASDDGGRVALRARLVAGYLPVVRHIARRYAGRGEPVDDLEQAGSIGLLNAIDRFDPANGADFLSYAIPTVTGEIRRHFRDKTWSMRVPRRLKDLRSAINGVYGPLFQQLGRAPQHTEIAAYLGIDVEDVLDGLEAHHGYRSASLDDSVPGTDAVLGDVIGDIDAAIDGVEDHQVLRALLDRMPPRERTILLLRFFGEMTQSQIAARVGLSQMHVSRLLSRSLAQLRATLQTEE